MPYMRSLWPARPRFLTWCHRHHLDIYATFSLYFVGLWLHRYARPTPCIEIRSGASNATRGDGSPFCGPDDLPVALAPGSLAGFWQLHPSTRDRFWLWVACFNENVDVGAVHFHSPVYQLPRSSFVGSLLLAPRGSQPKDQSSVTRSDIKHVNQRLDLF
jgi:hypothetical protein